MDEFHHGLLTDTMCEGNRPVRAGESCRAIDVGRRVAAEMQESRKVVVSSYRGLSDGTRLSFLDERFHGFN